MMPKDMSAEDVMKAIHNSVVKLLDDTASILAQHSKQFVEQAYMGECMTLWPLRGPDGEEIIDPSTGDKFAETENPESLAKLLSQSITRDDEFKRTATVMVDAQGAVNQDKIERSGRMIEVYGCKPWTRLKSSLEIEIGQIVKNKI